jgi:hypothetical protein
MIDQHQIFAHTRELATRIPGKIALFIHSLLLTKAVSKDDCIMISSFIQELNTTNSIKGKK